MSHADQITAQTICLRLSRRNDLPTDVRHCLEMVAELIVCQIHDAEQRAHKSIDAHVKSIRQMQAGVSIKTNA